MGYSILELRDLNIKHKEILTAEQRLAEAKRDRDLLIQAQKNQQNQNYISNIVNDKLYQSINRQRKRLAYLEQQELKRNIKTYYNDPES